MIRIKKKSKKECHTNNINAINKKKPILYPKKAYKRKKDYSNSKSRKKSENKKKIGK